MRVCGSWLEVLRFEYKIRFGEWLTLCTGSTKMEMRNLV